MWPGGYVCLLSVLLTATHVGVASTKSEEEQRSDAGCFTGTWADLKDTCCDAASGPDGDISCWDADHTFYRCCGDAEAFTLYVEDNMEEVGNRILGDLTTSIRVLDGGHAKQTRFNPGDYFKPSGVRFTFDTPSRSAQAEANRLEDEAIGAVKIFVHDLEPCAGEALLEHYHEKISSVLRLVAPSDRSWPLFVLQQIEHLKSLHDTILESGVLVRDPEEATVFYVPVFWSLAMEQALTSLQEGGSGSDASLDNEGVGPSKFLGFQCVSETFNALRDNPYYMRNAGFDHFWVAGIQHPFNAASVHGTILENYDPFAKNMMFLATGIRDYGFADTLVQWNSRAYSNLQRIFVPYSTPLHCAEQVKNGARLRALAAAPQRRKRAVAFVGAATSRVRAWAAELAKEGGIAEDPRVLLRFPDTAEVRNSAALSSRAGLAEEINARPSLNFTELYAETDFCLVLPGHLHDLTKRCYDAMAQGCLPVVVTKPRFWMALPFSARIPWHDFALFATAASQSELADVVAELLRRHEEDQTGVQRQRRALANLAPGTFCVHEAGGCSNLERGAFGRNILVELLARQRVWPHIRSSWFF